MGISRAMRAAVVERAGHRCEFCHLPLGAGGAIHFISITCVRSQHDGETALHNLAALVHSLKCPQGPELIGN